MSVAEPGARDDLRAGATLAADGERRPQIAGDARAEGDGHGRPGEALGDDPVAVALDVVRLEGREGRPRRRREAVTRLGVRRVPALQAAQVQPQAELDVVAVAEELLVEAARGAGRVPRQEHGAAAREEERALGVVAAVVGLAAPAPAHRAVEREAEADVVEPPGRVQIEDARPDEPPPRVAVRRREELLEPVGLGDGVRVEEGVGLGVGRAREGEVVAAGEAGVRRRRHERDLVSLKRARARRANRPSTRCRRR